MSILYPPGPHHFPRVRAKGAEKAGLKTPASVGVPFRMVGNRGYLTNFLGIGPSGFRSRPTASAHEMVPRPEAVPWGAFGQPW